MDFFNYNLEDLGPGLYSSDHLILLGVLSAITLSLVILVSRFNNKQQWMLLYILTGLYILNYVGRQIWLITNGIWNPVNSLPLHLCSFMIFFIPLAVIKKSSFSMHVLFALGFPGALVQLFLPVDYIFDFPILMYRSLESISSHALIVIIAILLLASKKLILDYRKIPFLGLTLVGLALISFSANLIIGGDANYMYIMKAPPGTPFVAIETAIGYGYLGVFLIIIVVIWLMMFSPAFITNLKKESLKNKPLSRD